MDLQTFLSLDGVEMAKQVQKRNVTPLELLSCSFEQLEKVNPLVNGVAHLRKEKVIEEAKTEHYGMGVFSGVPFFLKDTQALAGERMTSGSKLLKDFIAKQDSHLVKRFRNAGCLMIGHTTAPEFAFKNISEAELYGPTRNPWHTDYSPGGSSGGSAALIASGVVPIAGASDGGGSIRIPASFTSLFGLKPTRGRTPVGPGVGRQWHGAAIDFILSRSVRDSAAMLDELQVIQPEAAFQTPLYKGKYREIRSELFKRPLRIAFTTKSPVNTPVSEDAKRAVEKTVNWLEEEGHQVVEEDDNGVDGIQLMRNYFLMNSGEATAFINQMEQNIGRKITPNDVEIETWILKEAGKHVSAAEFSNSLSSWDIAAAQMVEFHKTYDFYITPASAHTAPKIGELTHSTDEQQQLLQKLSNAKPENMQELIYEMFLPSLTYTPFTQLANLTGQPAMSVPVHLSEAGLPLGVQVIAPKGDEHRLLQLATQLEQSDLWVGMKGNPFFDGVIQDG